MSYDFHQLSPYEFELLTRDLLQAEWGLTLESFKSGKDGGIDFRYAGMGANTIVQCKHYLISGFAKLRESMNSEREKVHRLTPSRYVLVTSVPLSPANKVEITRIVDQSILASADVIGSDDLNNLLGKHPDIEQRHFKLWLASRTVLDRVIHNASVTRSEFKAELIYDEAKKYVQTDAYRKARDLITEHNVVVVVGPPGVGKTTLANLLLYEHLAHEYQAIVLQEGVKEGLDLFQKGVKQVFHFDDFLGSTFLGDTNGALSLNKDQALIDFFQLVQRTPETRLIVTTRDHILAQAILLSEKLRHANLDTFKVELRLSSFSIDEKARILYNHLCFSNLQYEYLKEILSQDFYLEIVKHENFNPRVVDWLSSYSRVKNVSIGEYRTFVKNLLDNPSEIWRDAYERQISDAARSLLLTLYSLGGRTNLISLEQDFVRLHERRCTTYGFRRNPEDFRDSLKELSEAFVMLEPDSGIQVLDPSILDVLNSVVRDIPQNALDIVLGANELSQIAQVWRLANALDGTPIRRTLEDNTLKLVEKLREFVAVGSESDERERRIKIRIEIAKSFPLIYEMAEAIPSDHLVDIVNVYFEELTRNWDSRGLSIDEGRKLLNLLEESKSLTHIEVSGMKNAVWNAILRTIEEEGAWLVELIDMMPMIEDLEDSAHVLSVIRSAMVKYEEEVFNDELSQCNSTNDFDDFEGLLDALQDFAKVEVADMLDRTFDAREEFVKEQAEREAHLMDMWKDRNYDQDENGSESFSNDGAIRALFDSLR